MSDSSSNHTRLFLAVGIVALLASLIVLIPARVVVGLLGLPAGIVSGVTGTLWHGEIEHLTLGNPGPDQQVQGMNRGSRLGLGPVRWQVKPTRLLLGRLAADIQSELPDGFLNTTIAWSPGGTLRLSDLEGAAPIAWIAPAAADPGSQLSARFEKLVIADNRVAAAIGTLQMAGVVLPVATRGAPLRPGSYTLSFDAPDVPDGKPLTGELKDAGGPLELNGTVTITPPRAYEIRGTARARPNAPSELQDALTMLGPAMADGTHALSLAGTF
ncbi:MAG: type II secretion system protein N [Gammaproteobacteria bacterium]